MAERRNHPYLWVTWITRLLAGDAHCQWASWFRAHNTYQKRPDDFDLATWKSEHAEMVRTRAETLKKEGYRVFIEEQNKFNLTGQTGITLGGKPDIVAVRGDDALVVDCKTGEPRNSDYFQVLAYMLVLPHTHRACKGRSLSGELQYRNHNAPVPASKLTKELKERVQRMIHTVGGDDPLPRVPSFGECRFCDITSQDCPERVDAEPQQEHADHELF